MNLGDKFLCLMPGRKVGGMDVFWNNKLPDQTTTWLAQLGECQSAELEVAGSNPCWTNTQGL